MLLPGPVSRVTAKCKLGRRLLAETSHDLFAGASSRFPKLQGRRKPMTRVRRSYPRKNKERPRSIRLRSRVARSRRRPRLALTPPRLYNMMFSRTFWRGDRVYICSRRLVSIAWYSIQYAFLSSLVINTLRTTYPVDGHWSFN